MLTDQSLRYYRDSVAEEVSVFCQCSAHYRAAPGAPKQILGRSLPPSVPPFPDAKVLQPPPQGFVLLRGLLCLPASSPCFGAAKLCSLFYIFPLQAADLDGEIDLSTCYDVTEYPVQRNYGFQIHVRKMWGGGRVQLQDSWWGCLSMTRGTSPQTPKRGNSASPHSAPESCGLGFESHFFDCQKRKGEKGRFCHSLRVSPMAESS